MRLSAEENMRQRDMFDEDLVAETPVYIAGCGAVGHALMRQIDFTKVPMICIADPQKVDHVNVGAQGYLASSYGAPKAVVATAEVSTPAYYHIGKFSVTGANMMRNKHYEAYEAYEEGDAANDAVVFMCVDSMEARRDIMEQIRQDGDVRAVFDARLQKYVVRTIGAGIDEFLDQYEATLFKDEDAPEGPCTGRMSFFMANIAAGLLLRQYAEWSKRIVNYGFNDHMLDLNSFSMFGTPRNVDAETALLGT